jgi:3,4-dihydroxy-2-butanone 4-phosphate synthase
MLDLVTVMRLTKNNRRPGHEELTVDIVKAAGPIRTQ